MEFVQAYLPFIQLLALIVGAFIFFGIFQEQNGILQVFIICAAAYLAVILFENDPNQFINRFLRGSF